MTTPVNQTVYLEVEKILPSPTNPRKHFDAEELQELTDSIREHGVIQPGLVRPLSSGQYELVAGERRFRATQAAELVEFPVTIRELSDGQVLEIQLVENLQRSDLTVMEEAEGYHRALELSHPETGEPVYNVTRLAEKLGKKKRYIFQRLQIRRLSGEAQQALESGKIPVRTALALLRVQDEDMLTEVTRRVLHPEFSPHPLTCTETEELIRDEYTRDLGTASFDLDDATLLEGDAYPACLDCAKRTGAHPEIYGGRGRKDMCLDLPCFKLKTAAVWKETVAKAENIGVPVLEMDQGLKQFNPDSNAVEFDSPYVDLDEAPQEYELLDGVETDSWRELTDGLELPVTLARDHEGRPRELVDRKLVQAALEEADRDVLVPLKPTPPAPDKEKARAEAEKRRLQNAICQDAFLALLDEMVDHSEDAVDFNEVDGIWLALLEHVLLQDAGKDGCRFLVNALQLLPEDQEAAAKANHQQLILDEASQMSPAEQQALFIGAVMCRWLSYSGVQQPMFKRLTDLYELPMASIIRAVKAEVEKKKK